MFKQIYILLPNQINLLLSQMQLTCQGDLAITTYGEQYVLNASI